MSVSWAGSMPPLVSHSTRTEAPASAATRRTSRAYALSAFHPSKKCSASRNTRCPSPTRCATESRTIARFSSRVVRSARSTCRTSDFATIVATGAPDSRRCARSSAVTPPGLRVEPNAASVAVVSDSSVRARRKNSASLGFAPGQPPSMKPTPRSSRCRAIVSLSLTDSDRPSRWLPSRRVVS